VFDKREALVLGEVGDIRATPCCEVVDYHDLVVARQEQLREM
jgi:hypothetical protein